MCKKGEYVRACAYVVACGSLMMVSSYIVEIHTQSYVTTLKKPPPLISIIIIIHCSAPHHPPHSVSLLLTGEEVECSGDRRAAYDVVHVEVDRADVLVVVRAERQPVHVDLDPVERVPAKAARAPAREGGREGREGNRASRCT